MKWKLCLAFLFLVHGLNTDFFAAQLADGSDVKRISQLRRTEAAPATWRTGWQLAVDTVHGGLEETGVGVLAAWDDVREDKLPDLDELDKERSAQADKAASPMTYGGVGDAVRLEGHEHLAGVPPGRREEYFRPVSTTVKCVMILTMQSLVVYTALALSRNSDELSGFPDQPSMLTDTLATAARSIAYPPMMCCLFVACRMYVLATTEGLGEPQWWAKWSMIIASFGMTLQFLTVLTLPLVTAREESESFSEMAGQHHDVHPLLARHRFHSVYLQMFYWAAQVLCIVVIYFGIFAVVFAICSYPVGVTEVSPSVICTIYLTVLFFANHFFLWSIRSLMEFKLVAVVGKSKVEYSFTGGSLHHAVDPSTHLALGDHFLFMPTTPHVYPKACWPGDEVEFVRMTGSSLPVEVKWPSGFKTSVFCEDICYPPEMDVSERRVASMHGAAVTMTSAVRKAPMLAVLFLAARMRALQMHPPHGHLPEWAVTCLYAVVIAIFLETAAAAYVGATGREDHGYYGAAIFRASVPAHALLGFFGLFIYAGIAGVIRSNYHMTDADGKGDIPLSTTVKCVIDLSKCYFFVHAIGWLVDVLMNVFHFDLVNVSRACLAANVSVSFVPLIAILFVATRMRALQITQNKGAPQEWAQNCMFCIVFAVYLQALCCLALPAFTRGATRIGADGLVKYDMRPMVGAYTVTVVKYVALFCLHGGAMLICYSVYHITPENAGTGPPGFDTTNLIQLCAITLLVLILALLLSSAKVVGLAVKFAIESVDDTLLGVQITVESAALAVCRGYVNIQNLVVHNPECDNGKALTWTSHYLAKVNSMVVKIKLGKLIMSLGKTVEIDCVELLGIDVIYEKPSMSERSNVDHVMAHLDKLADAHLTEEQKAAKKLKDEADKLNARQVKKSDIPDIQVHEIHIKNIGASVVFRGMHARAEVADFVEPDFMAHLKKNGKHKAAEGAQLTADIVGLVLKTILKSVHANIGPALQSLVSKAGSLVIGNASRGVKNASGWLCHAGQVCSGRPGGRPGLPPRNGSSLPSRG